MQVDFTGECFECVCSFENRAIPKAAGFRWDAVNKIWYTPKVGIAAKLQDYLTERAFKEVAKARIIIDTWTKPFVIPKGERLYDFQENALLFALNRNRSYLALDPGLGKTPIAAVMAATLNFEQPHGFVYVCPPFLTRNTENEFNKWAPSLLTARYRPNVGAHQVNIIPDSLIAKEEMYWFVYNIVEQMRKFNVTPVLFLDEAHRFKNDDAARTQAIFGGQNKKSLAALFDRIVFLSGTPMPNRPIELFPVLSNSAPQTIEYMNKFEYAQKYCAAYENQWGWDFSGASNVEELAQRVMGTFMLRYKKIDVLKELPPKLENMVVLDQDLNPKLTRLSRDVLSQLSPEDLMQGALEVKLEKSIVHMPTYRKELGIHKSKACADYIKALLEDYEDESILVFAIHKDVISTLESELRKFDPFVITGETRMELRQAYVTAFQTDKKRRLFIGNIQAMGTGLTLTKATRVVFVEFSWVPADNDQASDRCHRIGQTDSVFVQYLVHENSIDKAVIETVLKKRKVTALI